MQNGF